MVLHQKNKWYGSQKEEHQFWSKKHKFQAKEYHTKELKNNTNK